MDPMPIMKAMIGQLEESVSSHTWALEFSPEKKAPPQWVKDARRTVNEAKQFVAMYEGQMQPGHAKETPNDQQTD